MEEEGKIELPTIPKECVHNAHMFYIKTKDLEERTSFIGFMKSKDILIHLACFCVKTYIPMK